MKTAAALLALLVLSPAVFAQDARTPISALPRVIKKPGSYYLTSDLVGTPGDHGIVIRANNVTLDLNGFSLIGTAQTLDGILVKVAVTNVCITNGTIAGWGRNGIQAANATNSQFTHLRVSHNGTGGAGLGIETGAGCTVTDCSVEACVGDGIVVGAGGTLTRCTARENSQSGIRTAAQCNVSQCTVEANGADGITASASNVTGCVARANAHHGIAAADQTMVRSCNVAQNGASGVDMADAGSVSDVTATGNGYGITVGPGCTIVGCTVSANKSHGIFSSGRNTISDCTAYSNIGVGIYVGRGCTVTHCTASKNALTGISLNGGGTVVNCTAETNGFDGIAITNNCLVLSNNCFRNLKDGIHAFLEDNRIEANSVTANDRGIFVEADGSTIFRNSGHGNTNGNYIILGVNDVGPIGAAATATSPWANIAY